MESRIEVIRRSCPVTAILVAAAFLGLCGHFTAQARAAGGPGAKALAQGRLARTADHYRVAMRCFRQAAAKGNGPAMNDTGLLYDNGKCVPQNCVLTRIATTRGPDACRPEEASWRLGVC